MKQTLTLLCSLLLLWGQVLVVSASGSDPAACHLTPKQCCCCHDSGSDMSCCQQSSKPEPLPATVPVSAQHQLLSFCPVLVLWVTPADSTVLTSPAAPSSLSASIAPVFARNCVRLI
jgi:hypothetical protein